MGTRGAGNTASGPMVTQPIPDVQASVRILICGLLAPPPAAASKRPDWDSNRRPHGCRWAASPLGHCLDFGRGPPCCLVPHLPLTKNPNCVYLSDCLLAGSGTDWLTVNLSSRCTAEGNRIFRCASLCCCVGDCVVGHYHLHPLHSWQDILLTFAEMELDSTTMFPPGTNVMFIRSTGEPVLAQVVGHSEHGDAYAEFFRFMLQFLCLQMCVYGGGVVPQGGGGRHLVTIPQGVVGDRLPWGGERQGGGGGGTRGSHPRCQ